jgi:hypothetical protein
MPFLSNADASCSGPFHLGSARNVRIAFARRLGRVAAAAQSISARVYPQSLGNQVPLRLCGHVSARSRCEWLRREHGNCEAGLHPSIWGVREVEDDGVV